MNCQSVECRSKLEEKWEKSKKIFHIRFWKKINVGSVNECWEYPKQGTKKYPGITLSDGTKTNAHRAAFMFFYGKEIPDGMFVCHKCDNPYCCNPFHLFLGTNSDNQQDCIKKGRKPSVKGSKNPMFGRCGSNNPTSKCTEETVKQIREKYETGLFSQKTIAKMFNMTQMNVSAIITRRTWKHI